jgi:hypothetical protein
MRDKGHAIPKRRDLGGFANSAFIVWAVFSQSENPPGGLPFDHVSDHFALEYPGFYRFVEVGGVFHLCEKNPTTGSIGGEQNIHTYLLLSVFVYKALSRRPLSLPHTRLQVFPVSGKGIMIDYQNNPGA